MFVCCTTFCGQEIVPAIPLVQMRAFYEIQLSTWEYGLGWANKFAFRRTPLLEPDASKVSGASAVILQHVDEPFLAVIIMEQGRIET
jgi:hypothetical protein